MATDAPSVQRNNRRTRLLHAAVALTVLVLLVTGWWLATGHEGRPSVLARIARQSDADLHRRTGWVLVALCVVALTAGVRGAVTFVRETVRADRGDLRWFARWPIGALTGRFAKHRRHFDPGQRLANIAFVVTIGTLVGTGIGMTTLHGGSTFAQLVRLHRAATWVLAVLVVGHVLLAIGILPGYRGAWRSMHFGGRTPIATVRRLWPADEPPHDPADAPPRPPHESRAR
jgi:cytochrome b subunit of formate dehydrogenase